MAGRGEDEFKKAMSAHGLLSIKKPDLSRCWKCGAPRFEDRRDPRDPKPHYAPQPSMVDYVVFIHDRAFWVEVKASVSKDDSVTFAWADAEGAGIRMGQRLWMNRQTAEGASCWLALLGMLSAFPAIITCPPHLIEKWGRELESVLPAVYVRELRDITRVRNDVLDFVNDYQAGRIPPKAVALVANSMMWRESTWEPCVRWKKVPIRTPLRDEHRHIIYDEVRDPKTGQVIDYRERRAITGWTQYAVCPTCGGEILVADNKKLVHPTKLGDMPARPIFCSCAVKGRRLKDGRKLVDRNGEREWGQRLCGAPLFKRVEKNARYSLGQYIYDHHRGFFKMLIADESHQYKAEDSARALAYYHLVRAVDRVVNMTGTMWGGLSTSILYLQFRTRHDIRSQFKFNDKKLWVSLYGVEETRQKDDGTLRDDEADARGNLKGTGGSAPEKPGVSPAIAGVLLANTIFFSNADLGYELPPYSEEVALVHMTDPQAVQYHKMNEDLLALAKASKRYLGLYFSTAIGRPNSGFRDDKVEARLRDTSTFGGKWKEKQVEKEFLMNLPRVIEAGPDGALMYTETIPQYLPKEEWLVGFVKSEFARHRKVLVYMRQTGTKDIQGRIYDVLQKANKRTSILRSGGETRKREALIHKKSSALDCLICNPRLVETGLDLVEFATVVYFEIEFSLYTLAQSIARIHRLGQHQPVRIVFAAYRETMEELALQLMGRKMSSSQLVYGDEATGALVNQDENDILSMLHKVMRSAEKVVDLQSIFAREARVVDGAQLIEPFVAAPEPEPDIIDLTFSPELEPVAPVAASALSLPVEKVVVAEPVPASHKEPAIIDWRAWASSHVPEKPGRNKNGGKKAAQSGQGTLF
jgi:hypothetical protein